MRILLVGLATLTAAGCIPLDNDLDGDGWPGDCDESDPGIHPAAIEVLDELDQDCDGVTDEGATLGPDDLTLWEPREQEVIGERLAADPTTQVLALGADNGVVMRQAAPPDVNDKLSSADNVTLGVDSGELSGLAIRGDVRVVAGVVGSDTVRVAWDQGTSMPGSGFESEPVGGRPVLWVSDGTSEPLWVAGLPDHDGGGGISWWRESGGPIPTEVAQGDDQADLCVGWAIAAWDNGSGDTLVLTDPCHSALYLVDVFALTSMVELVDIIDGPAETVRYLALQTELSDVGTWAATTRLDGNDDTDVVLVAGLLDGSGGQTVLVVPDVAEQSTGQPLTPVAVLSLPGTDAPRALALQGRLLAVSDPAGDGAVHVYDLGEGTEAARLMVSIDGQDGWRLGTALSWLNGEPWGPGPRLFMGAPGYPNQGALASVVLETLSSQGAR